MLDRLVRCVVPDANTDVKPVVCCHTVKVDNGVYETKLYDLDHALLERAELKRIGVGVARPRWACDQCGCSCVDRECLGYLAGRPIVFLAVGTGVWCRVTRVRDRVWGGEKYTRSWEVLDCVRGVLRRRRLQ